MLKHALLFALLIVGSQAQAQSLLVKRQAQLASEEVMKKLFPETPSVGLRTLLANVDGYECVVSFGSPGKYYLEGTEAERLARRLKRNVEEMSKPDFHRWVRKEAMRLRGYSREIRSSR